MFPPQDGDLASHRAEATGPTDPPGVGLVATFICPPTTESKEPTWAAGDRPQARQDQGRHAQGRDDPIKPRYLAAYQVAKKGWVRSTVRVGIFKVTVRKRVKLKD